MPSKRKWRVSLKSAHEKSGLTGYAVAKQTGLSESTVHRYINDDFVLMKNLAPAAKILADFYGVDWRDSDIVEVVLEEDNGESAPEIKTPALVPTM
ncbi:MAG: helix-turn-helix transcriptional regulator [Chloroflexota bacterium]